MTQDERRRRNDLRRWWQRIRQEIERERDEFMCQRREENKTMFDVAIDEAEALLPPHLKLRRR